MGKFKSRKVNSCNKLCKSFPLIINSFTKLRSQNWFKLGLRPKGGEDQEFTFSMSFCLDLQSIKLKLIQSHFAAMMDIQVIKMLLILGDA